MKRPLVGFLVLLLGGCVSGYTQFYRPNPAATPELVASTRAAPPPAVPLLDRSGDTPQNVIETYMRAGYGPIGYSSFNSGQRQSENGALEQGKTVGADVVVVVSPRYTGTVSTVLPITTPTSQTSYTTGSATAYGSGGSVTAYGNATTTTYGSRTNYIPININRYDYGAIYFVKRKIVLGANWRDLSDTERQLLQSNKGVYITSVVNDSPAFNYDVLPGDILLEINGQSAGSQAGYAQLLNTHRGETVELIIFRNGQRITKSVPLNR